MLGTPKFTDEFFDYSPYFHDGAIVSLKPTPRGYLLEMESAQLHLCDNRHLFPLSERNTLYGFLHIEGVRKILCDATKVHSIKQEEDFFSINTFDVSATEVCVTGQWVILSEEYEGYAPPYCIEISAEKIYWENTAGGQKPEMLGSYLGILPDPDHLVAPDWYCDRFGIYVPFEKFTEEVDVDMHKWHYRRQTFRNKETREAVDFDKGRFGLPGHAGADHYHRRNPDRTNRHNECLDRDGKPCGRYEDRSHFSPSPGKLW